MKVTSAHTGQVMELSELVSNGAVIKYINEHLLSIGFPAKGGVGPSIGLWRIEPQSKWGIEPEETK